ncbi:hypothetical protein FA95DRAFT_1503312 [Auriscalpium vulgare]|uniref:Uncharacterized protein n=1 Tax=Auriscalpium vulgare TaxID=40419 RepID=A0ACB8R7Q0_9AGAM|nr:hypothetical protein FA95DRAFT_1503312 [Auriscalpium vulgare]
MVGQSDDEAAPPPPGRPSRAAPPPRSAPPPPQPEPIEPSAVGQWELPSIPTGALDFGDSGATSDLSASAWSEDSTAYPSTAPTSIAPPSAEHTRRPSAQPSLAPVPPTHLTPDELKALWGRVGVQVHEAALSLLERSKRALVGNGSYAGFVGAVLEQVPNALPPQSASEYGYLVYAQTGGAVRTRASEILPGDVIVLEEAKLKGHKGLHNYSVIAGEGLPCVGVVSEYDAKKLKVKALQANQHVGQATVESVSYRLEDLKSGSIKVRIHPPLIVM